MELKKVKDLPPCYGKFEKKRADGSYGYVCGCCERPVGDHDGYCSECGARVSGTLFYLGTDHSQDAL